MSLTPSGPSDGNLAAQLRAEADQAVKSIPGAAALGDGEFASVLSRVSSAMNPQDQLRLVASYAREIATAALNEPRNLFDGRKAQAADATANPHAWAGVPGRFQLAGLGGKGGSGGDGEPQASSGPGASGAASVAFGSITQHSFAGTSFDKAGLSFGNFADMRSQGFNPGQIMAAVNTSKQLGLGPNQSPAAVARLQRDVPSAIPGLFTTRDNWKSVGDLTKTEQEQRARGNTAAADRLKREAAEAAKRAEEHDRREQERVRRTKPERVPDLMQKQKEIKERYLKGAAAALEQDPAVKAGAPSPDGAARALDQIVDARARRPDDPQARRDYAELKRGLSSDPRRAAGARQIDTAVRENDELRRTQIASNITKQRKDAAAAAVEDELFASMSGPGPGPDKKTGSGTPKPEPKRLPQAEPKKPGTKSGDPAPAKPQTQMAQLKKVGGPAVA